MKTVLCNGDSLGMPRDNVKFESTWFYKLSNKLSKDHFYFVNNFKRANTTNSLYSRDSLENYSPKIVIVQLGIVDCAPRLYNSNSMLIKIVNRLPFILKNIFWKFSKLVKQRSIKNADVNIYCFEENLNNFLTRCQNIDVEKCILIKIGIPGSMMIKKNPEIIRAINLYNDVYDKVENIFHFVKVVNPLVDGHDDLYVDDGYHLNEKGFTRVHESLIAEFEQC